MGSFAVLDLMLSQGVFTLGLALSAIVDIMITTFMCYFLRKNRTAIIK